MQLFASSEDLELTQTPIRKTIIARCGHFGARPRHGDVDRRAEEQKDGILA